mmetsp:Transcript_1548/g.2480  ORF Transcript_1548/g.2480 Transcript_1548/m.2480 type:complete len:1222 (-) Transcript_1548:234-3899(-)
MTDTAAETAQKNPNFETVQASTTTPVAKVASEKLELDEKDVFASPPAKEKQEEHDIVERSPGGRYLRFVERLGSGAYKDVYRAYDTIQGIEVAWNQVNLSGIPKSDKIRIINEVRLLEKLNHSNIISFHGSWVNREKETVIFVTEIMSSGTLKMFMKKVQVIRLNVAKRWAIQILNGLLYLHSQDPPVSHRDLKCDNIFINGTSGDLRIGDLGLSTAISKSKALSVLGTPEFMAPELYDENYDEKVDIYAFGMCLLEIFTKEVPYHECSNPAQIYKKVTNQIEPVSLSKVQISEAQELIRLCINTDPTKRPTAAELLNHPFLGPNASDAETEIIVVDDRSLSPIAEKVGNASSTSHTAAGSSVSDVHVTRSMTKSSTAIDVAQSSDVIQEGNGAADTSSATTTTTTENDVLLDSLSEMQLQEKESSMGKSVKALMGRPDEAAATKNEREMNSSTAEEGAATAARKQQEKTSSSSSQYVVAAECMEEVVTDNVMKLIISIPIQNETQHVQFDFHLVKDDPIQVAREMVTELHIPQQAILEISETISGLARDARVNLEKQNKRQAVQESTDLLSLGETEQNGASASEQTNGTNAADIAKSVSAPNLNEAVENANVPMKRNISAENPQQQKPQQQQQQQQQEQQQPVMTVADKSRADPFYTTKKLRGVVSPPMREGETERDPWWPKEEEAGDDDRARATATAVKEEIVKEEEVDKAKARVKMEDGQQQKVPIISIDDDHVDDDAKKASNNDEDVIAIDSSSSNVNEQTATVVGMNNSDGGTCTTEPARASHSNGRDDEQAKEVEMDAASSAADKSQPQPPSADRKQKSKKKPKVVLQKIGHCKIHLLHGNAAMTNKGKYSALQFCWQVTELYPTEVMVCCSRCYTWRHACCGGHYDYQGYVTIPTDMPSKFTAVCIDCHEEEEATKLLDSATLSQLSAERMEHLRQTMALNEVMRHAAFGKHSGTYKWPLGSVTATHINGHTRSVHGRHEKAQKAWRDLVGKLSQEANYRQKERIKVRTREFDRLLGHIEDSEGFMDRHNIKLFLHMDTMKQRPAGYENERRNFFDTADYDSEEEDDSEHNAKKEPETSRYADEKMMHDSSNDHIQYESSCDDEAMHIGVEDQAVSAVPSFRGIQPDPSYAKVVAKRQASRRGSQENPVVLDLTAADEQEEQPTNCCARPSCTKKPRFDSVYCSDGCGVSTLEKHLLRSLEYAEDVHPSLLRTI